MSRRDTTRNQRAAHAALLLLFGAALHAQISSSSISSIEWRRIGSTSVNMNLSSSAGGAAERVWFDGTSLHVRLAEGRVFATRDFEKWEPSAAVPTQADRNTLVRAAAGIVYRGGAQVWRSDDGGLRWNNLTEIDGQSLLGGGVLDLAVDPASPDRVAVAAETGVWISMDGGRTWAGLNDGLPNLAVRRILAAPRGRNGVRAAISVAGRLSAFEWRPGETAGWLESADTTLAQEQALRLQASGALGVRVSAASGAGETRYAGADDGRLWASQDGGVTWRLSAGSISGQVDLIWTDPADPRTALAIVSPDAAHSKLLRTVNAGAWWEDISANLADTKMFGVDAHLSTGAIYLATARGLYWTSSDLRAPAPATVWQALPAGWPQAKVYDVRLDDPGHLLFAAVDGEGVFAALAPHRLRQPVLVDAADGAERAAAPGALLSLLGSRAESVTAQGRRGAVLAVQDAESQIQLPYSLNGSRVDIEIAGRRGRLAFGLPLKMASPAIVVGGDGAPMVLDADRGLQLDALNGARGGMRLQVLMSGLGRVTPDWPVGLAAPLSDAPRVVAPLKAWIDGVETAVVRATLAPGYIGYYLVELQLPGTLPAGAFELSIEAAGERSNRVRLYTVE
ncbi:MAG: hypothetical protein HXY18_14785 [Bryobacteraceae bacterium]|nr:hypothetical protein [Bryobacteraceae bacterium]